MGGIISIIINNTYKSKRFGEYIVLRKVGNVGRKFIVKFVDTGFETTADQSLITRGGVKDYTKPIINGVGYLGSRGCHNRTTYGAWVNMLRRCYNSEDVRYARYGGRGITVCEEWHNYQNFAIWYEDNYKCGCVIDKDIISPESKEYSPESCEFVPVKINNLLLHSSTIRGQHSVGVCFHKRDKKFNCLLNIDGKQRSLGYFDTEDEAFEVYKKEKEIYVQSVATEAFLQGLISKRVYDKLLNWEATPYPEDLE